MERPLLCCKKNFLLQKKYIRCTRVCRDRKVRRSQIDQGVFHEEDDEFVDDGDVLWSLTSQGTAAPKPPQPTALQSSMGGDVGQRGTTR